MAERIRRRTHHHREDRSQAALPRAEAPSLARPDCRGEAPNHRRQGVNRAACHREEEGPNHRRQAVNRAACHRGARLEVDPNRRRRAVNRAACHQEVHPEEDPNRRLHRREAYRREAYRLEAYRLEAYRLEAGPSHHRHRVAHPEAFRRVEHLAAVPNRLHRQEVHTRRPACTASYRSRRHLDPVCSQRQRIHTLGCLLSKVQRVFGRSAFLLPPDLLR